MMKGYTLRELCSMLNECEFIRTQGNKALVRWANGLGGEVRLETRQSLQEALDLTEASEQMIQRAR